MSLSSDNFTALIHLRDQARKWKNITFITAILVSIILVKVIFFSDDSKDDLSQNSNYIAKVNIDGVILTNKYRSKILKEIADEESIKGVIISINSPGGGIVASEILYNEITKIVKNKPVVAVLKSIAASGGYMAAIASNHIIAYNGTLTGSIGVIIQSTEVTELAKKIGVKFKNYKSSHLKGSPSPFEKTDPLIDKVLNDSVKDSYEFFVDLVLKRRKDKIEIKNIKQATDGRIFNGRQAFEIGLVDKVGSEDDALSYLVDQHNVSKDLEIKEISLKKPENKIIDKLLNNNQLSRIINNNVSNKMMMAIW